MLSEVAQNIFRKLYCINGETIEDTFRRVSSIFTDENRDISYHYLINNIWRPNSPVFFNAGKQPGRRIYGACYVVPLEDSMDSIYDVVNVARKIFQAGAGIGIPIGNLREKDAPIFESTNVVQGYSSGPLKFLKVYDKVGDSTKSGGRTRRAAIMAAMPVWHPDLVDFIESKKDEMAGYDNMNLSVTITDKFMEALEDGVPFSIHTPYDGSIKDWRNASEIWHKIAESAWKCGDPGVIFIDEVNRWNPLKKLYLIESSNPCGEQFLPPWGVCSLSAINLNKCLTDDNVFNFDLLFEISYNVAGLMDQMLDTMDFPDKRFGRMAENIRPMGVGLMGFADILYKIGIRYGSKESCNLATDIIKTITHGCIRKSVELAKNKGCFPLYNDVKDDMIDIIEKHIKDNGPWEETLEMVRKYGVRNFQYTCIAPTGTTALSCDCSYGMEPCYGLVFQKNFVDGKKAIIVNDIFRTKFQHEQWYDNAIEKLLSSGSLKNIRGVPKEVKDIFVTAHDIKPKERIDVQAAFQAATSNAISSTVNLPETATIEDIKDIYEYAYAKKLKGVTIYRDGCKTNQPITFKKNEIEKIGRPERASVLFGATHSLALPDGDLLITVNRDASGKVVEIVLNKGKSGTLLNGLLEFIGRIISRALHYGMPLEEVIKQGNGISGEEVVWLRLEDTDPKPLLIKSIPDALSKLLKKFYKGGVITTNTATNILQKCPQCRNETLTSAEGCSTCISCGYSKCS